MKDWNNAMERIAAEGKVCLLLGAPDTGKSTFALELANFCLKKIKNVAVVDADIGQSDIGPPGVIGMGFLKGKLADLGEIELEKGYFVGSNSPEGLEIACVSGTFKMVQEALKLGAQKVIVDPTGAVFGRNARILKYCKVDMLKPDSLVVLQNRREIEHLVQPVSRRQECKIFRLPVPAQVRRKGREERRELRRQSFHKYFQEAKEIELNWEQLVTSRTYFRTGRLVAEETKNKIASSLDCALLHAERIPEGLFAIIRGGFNRAGVPLLKEEGIKRLIIGREEQFLGLLVGFLDGEGDYLGCGIIQRTDFFANRSKVLVPGDVLKNAKEVAMGSLRIRKDGEEIGRVKSHQLEKIHETFAGDDGTQ